VIWSPKELYQLIQGLIYERAFTTVIICLSISLIMVVRSSVSERMIPLNFTHVLSLLIINSKHLIRCPSTSALEILASCGFNRS